VRPLRRIGVASPLGEEVLAFRRVLKGHGLRTVCDAARCPNRPDCFPRKAAAFMILGDICTRRCLFCDVNKGSPLPLEADEARRLAGAVAALGLSGVVVTSPTRDDLADGGASAFADAISAIRAASPGTKVEVLTPDFGGDEGSLAVALEARPDLFNHNIETVPRLYPDLRPGCQGRPGADYRRSLTVLKHAAALGAVTKSALMLGLGEGREEVLKVLRDLLDAGCRRVVIGQYIPPSAVAWPLSRWVPEEEFSELGDETLAMGFAEVLSTPLARSSYQQGELGGTSLTK
jgi:lipoyl synthase